ncbi:MAG: PQQ-binding-like beta-propeller repeat protein [Pseudomonadota bacterium]
MRGSYGRNWSQGRRVAARARAALGLICVLLSGCSRDDTLEGNRFDIRTPLEASLPGEDGVFPAQEAEDTEERTVPISLPAPVNHSEWTHRNGGPAHVIRHPALGSTLTQIWSVSIGEGDSRRASITADPVVADGRIFTLDAASRVMAHSAGGAPVWSRDLVPDGERARDATGGGLAIGDGQLFVTTGFGALHALDPATGAVRWTQAFDAPVDGAPTVLGDLVYVTSRDNRAFAVRTENGRLEWQLPGAPTPSSTLGGAGPAVSDRVVVFPFGSAELVATLRRGGVRVWSATLAGQRRGRSYAGFSDITGDPVISGNVVYAGSPSGRIAALDGTSGERLWTATEGAMSPVWPVGGSLFVVTDAGQLVRLDASDGTTIWATDLPFFQNERPRRRQAVYAHYGPILAGGRLIVASDDGFLRSFDPRDGRLMSTVEIRGGATTNPVVVNNVLYIVSTGGRLHAFR